MYRTSAYTKGSARTHRLSYLYQSPNLYLTRTYSNNSPDPTAPFLEMASIVDRVYAARGVRYVQQKHITDILFTLSSLGFNIHAKREGAVLRHINVDSLPCLDAPARELLKYVATGKLLGFSLRLCAATPAARRGPRAANALLESAPCTLCVMQGSHGVVRSDVGDRRAGTGDLSGGWGKGTPVTMPVCVAVIVHAVRLADALLTPFAEVEKQRRQERGEHNAIWRCCRACVKLQYT